jgi:hypothetical protein
MINLSDHIEAIGQQATPIICLLTETIVEELVAQIEFRTLIEAP